MTDLIVAGAGYQMLLSADPIGSRTTHHTTRKTLQAMDREIKPLSVRTKVAWPSTASKHIE